MKGRDQYRRHLERSPQQLIDALMASYWQGRVSQAEAAKLLGIRRQEFVELSALRWGVAILQSAAWRYFMTAFNSAFPECDPALARREEIPSGKMGVRMYTDAELLSPPHVRTLRELLQHGTDLK